MTIRFKPFFISVKVPFTKKFYKGYDVVNNTLVYRWWKLIIALTPRGNTIVGVDKRKLAFGYWFVWGRTAE